MKIFGSLVVGLQALQTVYAANTCNRDPCYKQVALQNNGSPGSASRKIDCQAVLKTVTDDDSTVIVTTFVTTFPTTSVLKLTDTITTKTSYSTISQTIVSTITEVVPTTSYKTVLSTTPETTSDALVHSARKRRTAKSVVDAALITASPLTNDNSNLEARDKIIVAGNKPTYVPACLNIQAYAKACLCWGVTASTIRKTSTKTMTVRKTAISTSYATATNSITSTIVSSTITTLTIKSTSTGTETVTSTTTTQVPVPTKLYKLQNGLNNGIITISNGYPRSAYNIPASDSLRLTLLGKDSRPYITDSQPALEFLLETRSTWKDFGQITVDLNAQGDLQYMYCTFDKDVSPSRLKCHNQEETWTELYMCEDGWGMYLGKPGIRNNNCYAAPFYVSEVPK